MKLGTLSQHPSSAFWNGWSSFPAGCGQKGSVTSLHVDPFSCLSALVPERTARWGLCPLLSPEGAPLHPGLHPVTPLSGCRPSALSIPPAHWYSVVLGTCHPQPWAMAVHVLGLSLSIISLRTGTPSTYTLTLPSAEIFDKYLIRFDFIISIRVKATLLHFHAIMQEVEGCCGLGKNILLIRVLGHM